MIPVRGAGESGEPPEVRRGRERMTGCNRGRAGKPSRETVEPAPGAAGPEKHLSVRARKAGGAVRKRMLALLEGRWRGKFLVFRLPLGNSPRIKGFHASARRGTMRRAAILDMTIRIVATMGVCAALAWVVSCNANGKPESDQQIQQQAQQATENAKRAADEAAAR